MKAYYHLPGLFEFYKLYSVFLPLFREHQEYFYDWCDIGSIYGAPSDCIWAGGRVEIENGDAAAAIQFVNDCNISARLTFSNSLLKEEHMGDKRCNALCDLLIKEKRVQNGIIIFSDMLLGYLKNKFPGLYFVSSTTKVLDDFDQLTCELERDDFRYVVADFRLNKELGRLKELLHKDKVEFLCNECCSIECGDRKACYEAVSRLNLGIDAPPHICRSRDGDKGYSFYTAMHNPAFIGIDDIIGVYGPMGFDNFKIEGRGLGSAMLLEFLLYYMVRPEYHIKIREDIYLDSMLDLF